MTRPMGKFEVLQRTSDGFFDGNALLSQWKREHPTCKDSVSDFLEQKKVQAFIAEMEGELGEFAQPHKWVLAETQEFKSIKYIKGKNTAKGRTKDQVWMHPSLFIKFAMWINPKFELQVIKFVYDELIKYRHLAAITTMCLPQQFQNYPIVTIRLPQRQFNGLCSIELEKNYGSRLHRKSWLKYRTLRINLPMQLTWDSSTTKQS